MSDSRVNRLGTGNSIVVGPRVSRAIYGALLGDWPGGPVDEQAVLIDDASIVAAFMGCEDGAGELDRVNQVLRAAGIEQPLGHRGVHDLAMVLTNFHNEIDGILADAGVPYTARGIEGVRALLTSFEAARAEVQRLDGEVKQLRTDLYQARRGADGEQGGYDPEDTILQPVYSTELTYRDEGHR